MYTCDFLNFGYDTELNYNYFKKFKLMKCESLFHFLIFSNNFVFCYKCYMHRLEKEVFRMFPMSM